jgi:hypothetical protein
MRPLTSIFPYAPIYQKYKAKIKTMSCSTAPILRSISLSNFTQGQNRTLLESFKRPGGHSNK